VEGFGGGREARRLMPSEFTFRRRVEFADTDAAGVIHFTALFRFMEEAEHAFYRSLGGAAFQWQADRVVGMPRLAASCDYLGPIRYGEEVVVRLVVREKRTKVLRYDVEFSREDAEGPVRVANGSMTVVYAERPHGEETWSGADLPPELARQIEAARS